MPAIAIKQILPYNAAVIEVKILDDTYRLDFDRVVQHPIQSWNWGEFKKALGNGSEVERVGIFEDGTLIDGLQIVFTKVPKLHLSVGYVGKCSLKYAEIFSVFKQLAKKHNAIFIKTEPNIYRRVNSETGEPEDSATFTEAQRFFTEHHGIVGMELFTKYDFHLALDKTADELLKSFHQKTRYNTRLAERKGVTVVENTTVEGMKNYVRLMLETTARQGFFNHNEAYFLKLLEVMPPENICILEAHYEQQILTAWILFNFNGKLYYPYGASSNAHRNVMPNNLVMWTAIQYGLQHNCNLFDMWGCLGPHPDENDNWFGFHKFKAGYNPQLVEYVGTYDFVFKPVLYKLFNKANKIRWAILLKNKAHIR